MKKFILMIIIVFVFGIVFWMGYSSFDMLEQKEIKKEIRIDAIASLPSLSFTDLSGTQQRLNEYQYGQSLMLILFNPECEHCQYEAKDIASNISSFDDTSLVFISAEPLEDIHRFAEDYGLTDLPNVTFGSAKMGEMHKVFQRISFPSIFIYGPDKKLKKEFSGETKIDLLLEYSRPHN